MEPFECPKMFLVNAFVFKSFERLPSVQMAVVVLYANNTHLIDNFANIFCQKFLILLVFFPFVESSKYSKPPPSHLYLTESV